MVRARAWEISVINQVMCGSVQHCEHWRFMMISLNVVIKPGLASNHSLRCHYYAAKYGHHRLIFHCKYLCFLVNL